MVESLRVVIIKPSKYTADGAVERFRRGFMPNSTVPHVRSMVPSEIDGRRTPRIEVFVQCDTQIAKQESLVELLAKAGCYQMFVGVESFDRATLVAANKKQNRPEAYQNIVRLCREHGIGSHFSNIIGFPQDTEESIETHLDVLHVGGLP